MRTNRTLARPKMNSPTQPASVRQAPVLEDAAAVDQGAQVAAAHLHLDVMPDPGARGDPVDHGELVDAQAVARVHARQGRPEMLRPVCLAAAGEVEQGEVAPVARAEDQADIAVRHVVANLEGGAEVPVRGVGREREPAPLHAAAAVGVDGVDRLHPPVGHGSPFAAGKRPRAGTAEIKAHPAPPASIS